MRRTREADSYTHSLTDLMAGVAAIFLLIAIVFILIAAKRGEHIESQVEEFKKLRTTILDRLDNLRRSLQGDDRLRELVSIDEAASGRDPFLFVIVFNRRRLSFAPTKCELQPEQDVIVTQIAPPVLSHVCKFVEDLEEGGPQSRAAISMTLEGHTDRRPFRAARVGCGIDRPELTERCAGNEESGECQRVGFENNVRLSGARAQNVFFSMQRAVAGEPGLSRCLERYFVVAGRGPVEPTDNLPWRDARSAADDDANRRVLLKIRAQAVFGGSQAVSGAAKP